VSEVLGSADPSRACPRCGAELWQTEVLCPQCGLGRDAFPSESKRDGESAASPLAGLTPQEAPELYETSGGEQGDRSALEMAVSLPEWLYLPLPPRAQAALSSAPEDSTPSPPPGPAVELPPLPSELPPASMLPVLYPSPSTPVLAAWRVSRLQELAEKGPWSEADLRRSGREDEAVRLPRRLPSVLLAECRPGTTTAALIEGVDRQPRFVAGGQASTESDPIGALRRAAESIAVRTGRRLFDERGMLVVPRGPTGHGVDRFVAVVDVTPVAQGLFTLVENSRYEESLQGVQGLEQLRGWSGDGPLRSVPFCLGTVIRYLGDTHQANVVGLDLGLAQSWLVAWYGERLTLIAGDGVTPSAGGHGAAQTLITSLWRQCAWESESVPPYEPPALDLIVARGPALSQGMTPLEITQLLVDTLQPTGTCTLLWDKDGLAVPLAALALSEPAIATCLLEGDAFLRLGTVVAPRGQPPTRGIALRFTLAEAKGRRQQGNVASGEQRLVRVPLGHSARLTLYAASGWDLGTGGLGREAQAEIPGGLVGLLLDARGRPLPGLD